MRCKNPKCQKVVRRPASGSKALAEIQGFFVCGECRNKKTGIKYYKLSGVVS